MPDWPRNVDCNIHFMTLSMVHHPAMSQEVIRTDNQLPLLEIILSFRTDRAHNRDVQPAIRKRPCPKCNFDEFDDFSL